MKDSEQLGQGAVGGNQVQESHGTNGLLQTSQQGLFRVAQLA